ncbi:methyl-accepting chemotaxis protein [Brevundimonas sp. TWP2-3-2]|uniref:methyl-accepting chemotaxis protein n=1 Tax=unclassified Brevundimonas TaxID=2622653 RepID=UPI003CF2964D
MTLANIKISRRLAGAFAFIVLIIVALSAAILLQVNGLETRKEAVSLEQKNIETINGLKLSLSKMESNTRVYVVYQNPRYLSVIEQESLAFDAGIAKLREQLAHIDGAAGRIDTLEQAEATYRTEIVEKETRLAANPATRGQAVAIIQSGVAGRHMEQVETAFEDIRSRAQGRIDAANAANEAAFASTRLTLMVGVGLALILSVAFGLILTRGIVGPVNNMIGYMRRLIGGDTNFEVPCVVRKDEFGEMGRSVIAFRDAAIEKTRLEAEGAALRGQSDEERARNQRAADAAAREQASVVAALGEGLDHLTRGDLTYTLTQSFPDDYVKLKEDFNAAIGQLKDAMSVVAGNVSAIRSGAGEIAQASDDLSRRTEQQAASLEETAAALDEITATVNRTASGARQASETVQAAKGDAETSGNVVRDAVGAMGAIEKSAQEISQIIGVIDEIAFQTNLLALNAGVEAARAGDAGRGFAVVASEVRALAQRSAEAAKEIKVLISASTSQVNAGVALVGQTGEALQRIVGRVAEIDGLVSEIAASAQEQATGLQQVNTAVNQMDQVTQQNAAMVEQSTAASHSLSQEAETLAGSVSRFQIGAVAHAPAERGAPRSQPRPANRPVAQMRTVGSGGAARKPQPVASEDGWEEF